LPAGPFEFDVCRTWRSLPPAESFTLPSLALEPIPQWPQ
jgi:hypothetical protein